jgi:signal transduction histidine kinase
MMVTLFSWLLLVLGLGVWWQSLLLDQAERIAQLEVRLNPSDSAVLGALVRTQNMLFWESTTFLVLLAGISVLIVVFHLREQLRARSVEAFFAGVTHELRTPLTSIRLQAESLSDSLRESEDSVARPLLDRLLQDTSRLESQVERVLELARVEGGGRVYLQPLAVEPWLKRTLTHLREGYGERLSFEVLSDARDSDATVEVAVYADPSSLQTVLRNIVENSVRHSGKSPVHLICRLERTNSHAIRIHLQDNGASSQDQKVVEVGRLGALFYKGSRSQGAGVGLYLVRALVERMDGSVTFGFGSSGGFTVSLNLKEVGPSA